MNLITKLNHRDRARRQLIDLISTAKFCGITSKELNDKYIKILESVKHCPQWVREYLRGYHECQLAEIYSNCLMFGGYVNGKFYSTHSKREDYYQKHGIEPSAFNGLAKNTGHYWTTTKEPKPFFNGEYNEI